MSERGQVLTDMSGRVTISLPWALLVRDNAKYGVMKGRMILTSEYRNNKQAAALRARQQVLPSRRLTGRCQLVAVFHEPDRDRVRDVSNYAKFLCDSLTGVAYDDDGLIDDARYVRGAVDPAAPRVVVELTPLDEAPQ